MVRISTIGVVLAVLVAAAVASVTSNDASARPSGGSISLVAYSTPRDAYAKLIPAFTDTSAGQRHLVPAVLRRLGRAGARRDRRPQGRRRRVLARAGHDVTRQGELVAQAVEEEPVPRHRHALGRRLRRPQGQPEAHPHLERPDQARRRRRRAERPDLGRRQVGRDRGLRRAAQARQVARAGRSSTSRSSTTTSSRRTRAPARRCRRSSPAAATSCSRTRTRRSSPRSTTSRSTT